MGRCRVGDFSTHYDLGQINAYTTHQDFTVHISPDARPVGVVCKNQGYDTSQLTLVCIQSNNGNRPPVPRKFVATSCGAVGDALMYIGHVQLQKAHQHQVDIGQSVLYSDPNSIDFKETDPHTHANGSITDSVYSPVSEPLMVFEISED